MDSTRFLLKAGQGDQISRVWGRSWQDALLRLGSADHRWDEDQS